MFILPSLLYLSSQESYAGGWSPSCPDGWTMFSIRCLLYVPKKMTWTEAEVIRMIPYSECFYTKLTLYLLAHLVNWHLPFGVPLLRLFLFVSLLQKNCQSHILAMQGNLASVLDTGSSDEIKKVMQSAGHKNGQIWVGGCDTTVYNFITYLHTRSDIFLNNNL